MEQTEINYRSEAILTYLGYRKENYIWTAPLGLKMRHKFPKHIWSGDNSNSFKFHSSWNWIMPLIEHIEKDVKDIVITSQGCVIVCDMPIMGIGETKIETLFYAASDYCLWRIKMV